MEMVETTLDCGKIIPCVLSFSNSVQQRLRTTKNIKTVSKVDVVLHS